MVVPKTMDSGRDGSLGTALLTNLALLAAIRLEERDLIVAHGETYRRYRRSVPMLVPRPRALERAWTKTDDAAKPVASKG